MLLILSKIFLSIFFSQAFPLLYFSSYIFCHHFTIFKYFRLYSIKRLFTYTLNKNVKIFPLKIIKNAYLYFLFRDYNNIIFKRRNAYQSSTPTKQGMPVNYVFEKGKWKSSCSFLTSQLLIPKLLNTFTKRK